MRTFLVRDGDKFVLYNDHHLRAFISCLPSGCFVYNRIANLAKNIYMENIARPYFLFRTFFSINYSRFPPWVEMKEARFYLFFNYGTKEKNKISLGVPTGQQYGSMQTWFMASGRAILSKSAAPMLHPSFAKE